jgi:hypothetical protein
MFKSFFRFLQKLNPYHDPFFEALDDYLQRSHQEIIASLNKPREKSQFEKDADDYVFNYKFDKGK